MWNRGFQFSKRGVKIYTSDSKQEYLGDVFSVFLFLDFQNKQECLLSCTFYLHSSFDNGITIIRSERCVHSRQLRVGAESFKESYRYGILNAAM